MEEFDAERCCLVCLWTGDSRLKVIRHMKYMHSDVFAYNLSPAEKGYQYLAEDSGVPRCEVCNIFVGTEFVSDHPKNANHLNNLAQLHPSFEEGSYNSVSNEIHNDNDEEAYFDPDGGGDLDRCAASEGGDDGVVESYEDACDFPEDRYNTFTTDDWSSRPSWNLDQGNAVDIPYTSARLSPSLPLDFSEQVQNLPYDKEHVGETFLSCVEVTVDGVSSLHLNTKVNLEERAYDWRKWKTVCVIDTSVTSEVCEKQCVCNLHLGF